MRCLFVAGTHPLLAADDKLTVTQDESSMERVIKKYLVDKYELLVEEKEYEKDDMYLVINFPDDIAPAFNITIDSQDVNHDKETDTTLERAVVMSLFTNIKVPDESRTDVLGILNDFNRKMFFATFYIDTDGEISGCWAINVMDDGIATDYVYDATGRLKKNWLDLYPKINEALTQE